MANVFSDSLGISASGLQAQSARMRHISENIANADTPGYHRKLIAFAPAGADLPDGAIAPGRVILDPATPTRIFDPGHPMAGADGYYDGSNVDLMVELADAREAARSYEANLRQFEQVRQMSSALMDLLRR